MTNLYAPPATAVRDIVPPAQVLEADRGARLAAAMIDGLIFAAMVYVPLLVALIFDEPSDSAGDGVIVLAGFALALAGFVVWLFLTILYMRRNGQSIAKKMLGIKVVRADGSPVSLARLILLRNVLNSMLSMIPFYGLIDVLFIFGESRQCLHDKIADTIVVVA